MPAHILPIYSCDFYVQPTALRALAQGAAGQLSSGLELTCECCQTELPAASAASLLAAPCPHVHSEAGIVASVHCPRTKRLCWGPPGMPL